MSINKVTIFTDGAARGNPGPAAIGAVIRDESGSVLATISKCLGTTTNNQAEYCAIIAALEKAVSLGAKSVEIFSDSLLVVEQICGRYKIKHAALRTLYQDVVKLIGSLESFKITYVPRERNKAADELANQALDNAK
ncbi:MAG TPA: ribonuclease HI family protein [Dehalococcoidales bacterium]|nr:ribonuclease HI family protein [Dehalococcoidales bacterium]